LAQALVHNPDVLILDEPTIGLDPKQIIEVRELIKGLAGNHTIILSTHILPEASKLCERVVIIDKGRIVAEETPDNLTRKLGGAQRMSVTIGGPAADVKTRLSALSGILKVNEVDKEKNTDITTFQVESAPEGDIRPLLAKTVVDSNWSLYEMKPEGMSLEDVFLQLTTKEEEAVQ
jgi:ABC-2 type transport system ATP-binding protein